MCVRNSNKVILIIEFRQLSVKTGHFLTTKCLQKVLRDFFVWFFVCWFVCVVVFLFVCIFFYTDSGDSATLQRLFVCFWFVFSVWFLWVISALIVLVPERADYLFEILSPENSVPRVVFSKQTVLISCFRLFFCPWKMSVPGSTFGTRQFTRSHLWVFRFLLLLLLLLSSFFAYVIIIITHYCVKVMEAKRINLNHKPQFTFSIRFLVKVAQRSHKRGPHVILTVDVCFSSSLSRQSFAVWCS